ncbi:MULTISPECIES: hypothetical protein [Acinetobacter]|uniref:Bbp19 family protein n=1 Tax=Acinetobacter TaxID=469 RepID=UPI00044C26A1|nr:MULTISPECIES: hypothetical protein [Acinetobacter]EXB83024.1 hypothetical protein J538_2295 [Acinetobacter sp. 272263]MCK4081804.1 hypothetical protein [Acinetobacter radioresistens]MCU4607611.1 hypothetical protein [Acinetobacter radioresistens]HAV5332158.1 hypothetical protein [Acinetobacter baumannii]
MRTNKYQRVFTSNEGIEVLDELISIFHTQLAFDKDSATQTAFNLGQQDVINFILARIKEAEQPK